MAAAYLFHLCRNHGFVDGNKRTALAAAEIFAVLNGHALAATNKELEALTVGVASGGTSKEAVKAFFRTVRAGFSQRRKTLRNALSGGLRLPPAEIEAALISVDIDPRRRAQTLSLQEWADLVDALEQLD